MISLGQLSDYFQRIGYQGTPRADEDTLQKLHFLHVQSIAFENINPLLQESLRIDRESIWSKLVYSSRGGYCFEQNYLFSDVLQKIGFQVSHLGGRVLLGRAKSDVSSKSHMLLKVSVGDQTYISDVGFGGRTPSASLLHVTDTVQKTPHETYRIVVDGDGFLLETKLLNQWKLLYRFTTLPRHYIDYKVYNWYTSTHPDSHFTQRLTVAIAGENCRYSLSNQTFKQYFLDPDKESIEVRIENSKMLKEVLETVFKIRLVDENMYQLVFERIQEQNGH